MMFTSLLKTKCGTISTRLPTNYTFILWLKLYSFLEQGQYESDACIINIFIINVGSRVEF